MGITNKHQIIIDIRPIRANNELLERNMLHLLDASAKDFQDTMYPASSPAEHA